MAVDLRNASLRLYEALKSVGVSEEMRLVHREAVTEEIIKTILFSMNFDTPIELYNFGSFSEGSTLSDLGSDVDIVSAQDGPVVTDVRDAGVTMSMLMVQDAHTFPGYLKLQAVDHGRPLTIANGLHEPDMHGRMSWEPIGIPGMLNEIFELDAYGRMCWKHLRIPGVASHGPALDGSNRGLQLDFVMALKCPRVPENTRQWLRRPRRYGWPSRQSLDRMARFPHFVVGVGHPFSRESDIEWRLSYSLHERELMFSLNPAQHQCYVFLKMTKKSVIEPAVGEESISSYHCKTALFWAIENTPADMWRPDMLLQCIFVCFWYLSRFVINMHCPNFFNPMCNLFEREVFLRLKDRLSSTINLILRSIPDFITLIKCSGLWNVFRTGHVPEHVLTQIVDQRCMCSAINISGFLALNKQLSHLSHMCRSHHARVQSLDNLLNTWSSVKCIAEHTEEQTDEARHILLPCVHFRLATCLAAEALKFDKGPLRNQLLASSGEHLRWSRDRDLVTSRLIRVTVAYKLGYLVHCESILQEIENDLKPYVMSFCKCSEQVQYFFDEVRKWMSSEKPSARNMMTRAIVTCVTFLPSEREIIPEPLLYELDRSRDYPDIPSRDVGGHNVFDWACVDGKVYLHLMKYLVFSQRNKPVHTQMARDNLKWVINNDPNLRHKDTAFNVLGWIYSQEGAYREAHRCWRLSLEIRPYNNAANRYFPDLSNNQAQ